MPISGFSHSASLETYVQQGLVKDAAIAKDFVVQMLSQNLKYTDAAFVLLYFPAAQHSWHGMLLLIIIYTLVTLLTMIAMVILGYYGLAFLKIEKLEKYMYALGGLTLLICGAVMVL